MTKTCVLVFDHWFLADPHGSFQSSGNYSTSALAARYLQTFDNLLILGRCREARSGTLLEQALPTGVVRLYVVTSRAGVTGALTGAMRLCRALLRRPATDAVILKVPGMLSLVSAAVLRPGSYGVEMVGDARESMVALRKSKALSKTWAWAMAKITARAGGVAYVTPALQKQYPAAAKAFTSIYSSIQMPEDQLRTEPRIRSGRGTTTTLVTVARLETPYKGVDVLLRALADLPTSCNLSVVGGGRLLERYQKLSESLSVADRVTFHGNLSSRTDVIDILDSGDIYVQPSLTEGLPRALIEAMARGLPCVATNVGGVPDLLENRWLVTPGSSAELSARLSACLDEPVSLCDAGQSNLARAAGYSSAVLQPRRDNFYKMLLASADGG